MDSVGDPGSLIYRTIRTREIIWGWELQLTAIKDPVGKFLGIFVISG